MINILHKIIDRIRRKKILECAYKSLKPEDYHYNVKHDYWYGDYMMYKGVVYFVSCLHGVVKRIEKTKGE